MVYYYYLRLRNLFVTCLLFILNIALSLFVVDVSMFYFILAVLVGKCSIQQPWMSSPYSIDILNGTCSLHSVITF